MCEKIEENLSMLNTNIKYTRKTQIKFLRRKDYTV